MRVLLADLKANPARASVSGFRVKLFFVCIMSLHADAC